MSELDSGFCSRCLAAVTVCFDLVRDVAAFGPFERLETRPVAFELACGADERVRLADEVAFWRAAIKSAREPVMGRLRACKRSFNTSVLREEMSSLRLAERCELFFG